MSNKGRTTKLWIYGGLIILIFLFPLIIASGYWIHMVTIGMIYILLVASLDLLYGYTGLITMGHGAFFGIGAYACGILQVKMGLPFWPSLLGAIVIAGVVAFLIGVPMLRTRGPYFALGTMAVAAIIQIIIANWDSVTGGHSLYGIPKPSSWNFRAFTIDFGSKITYYYLVLVFVVFTIFVVKRLAKSRWGRAFVAIRENEELAQATGINLWGYKLLSFVIASCLAAIGGGLYASYMGAIEPAISGFNMGFTFLAMTIIGGPTTIGGYVVGSFIVWVLPEFLGFAEIYRPLLYGLLLVLVIIFMPQGIMGRMKMLHPAIARWIP
jgi:branched-chain amino acid transport system permease protein